MSVGEAICTRREVVAVVNRPQDIEEEAMSFFGGSEGDADESQGVDRHTQKGPGSDRDIPRLLVGRVIQAVAVRNFFSLISSFARSQSSSS
jgi:hypothetical protein